MKKLILFLSVLFLFSKGESKFFTPQQLSEIQSYLVKPIDIIEVGTLKKHFDWVNDWITPEHYPIRKSKGTVRMVYLIKYDTSYIAADIIMSMYKRGYMPATTPYLIGLGIQYPELQEKYKYILALDMNNAFPDSNGNNTFIFLREDNMRRIDIIGVSRNWNSDWYILAFKRKQN